MPSLSQAHRPHRFSDVTGQTHVTETLRREVATGRLAHAYVFSGPRGVGKTTSARIFAQALNCQQPLEGEPCGNCDACKAFAEGRLLDIIELDAATHTGVDTIRESIIEHVRFAPAFGKAKVYILDEAHMLSASSWNALLKTLEEPPAYAYFILATTEWHKIPATILSRCQRFEFKRVADDVLTARIRDLASREGWSIDEEVVRLIVSRADGCVRDAETLLGQLGSLGEKHIDAGLSGLVIPPTHLPLAAGLMQAWFRRDHGASLQEARRLVDEGVGILPLFDDLLTIVRHLLRAAALPETARNWPTGTAEERAMATLLGQSSPAELHDIALMLMERRKDAKAGVDPLFALELASTMVACGMLSRSIENRVSSIENNRDDTSVGAGFIPPVRPTPPPAPTVIPPSVEVKIESTTPETPIALGDINVAPTEPPIPDTQFPTPDTRYPIPDTSALEIGHVRLKWSAIIRAVDEKNHALPFILKISQPHEIQGETLIIRFQYPFHKDKIITDVKNRHMVEACARAVLGVSALTIDGMIGEDVTRTEERNQDMVANILKAFGGQVVEGGS